MRICWLTITTTHVKLKLFPSACDGGVVYSAYESALECSEASKWWWNGIESNRIETHAQSDCQWQLAADTCAVCHNNFMSTSWIDGAPKQGCLIRLQRCLLRPWWMSLHFKCSPWARPLEACCTYIHFNRIIIIINYSKEWHYGTTKLRCCSFQ